MTTTHASGPFVHRRHKPAKGAHAWRKPGHEPRHAPAAEPSPSGGGVGLLGCFLILLGVGLAGGGGVVALRAVSEHRAAVAASARQAELERAAAPGPGGTMSAAEAARIVAGARQSQFAGCFQRIEEAGWPTASTPAATRDARRVALAECLVGN